MELATWELSKHLTKGLNATVYLYSLTKQGVMSRGGEWIDISDRKLTLHEFLNMSNPDVILIQHLKGHPHSLKDEIRTSGIPYIVFLHDFWYMCKRVTLYTMWNQRCPGSSMLKCLACVGPLHDTMETVNWWRDNRSFLNAASHLVAVSLRVKKIYGENGLDTKKFSVLPPVYELPTSDTFDGASNEILYLGGINRVKGFELFREALTLLPKAVDVAVGGNGITAEVIARLPKQHHYRILGHVSRKGALAEIRKSRLVVCPSVGEESYGRVATESLAFNVPVIVTQIGGFPERMLNSHATRVVKDSPKPLSDAIQYLLGRDDRNEFENIVRNFNYRAIRTGAMRILQVVDVVAKHEECAAPEEHEEVDYSSAVRWNQLLERNWSKFGTIAGTRGVPEWWTRQWMEPVLDGSEVL